MTRLQDYQHAYRCMHMSREDGVLLLRLHTDEGPFVFDEETHHAFGAAFTDIADDTGNRVVVLTGTGDRFCADFDQGSFRAARGGDPVAYWTRIRRDGYRMLQTFADIEVPVIAAVNGPAVTHSELPMLADVVLASETACFRDATHFIAGIPPGDGMNVVWEALLGPNRARYFLMTGQTLSAHEAQTLGAVAEVLPRQDLLGRAMELARGWAALPLLTLQGTRTVLNTGWRRRLAGELHASLTYEALADLHRAPHPAGPSNTTTKDGVADLLQRP
ncbi:enoyl-CoA hydratase/isomerase family protein [Streptomyces tendae]